MMARGPLHVGGSDVDYDVMFEKMSGKDGQLDLAELEVAVQVRSDANGISHRCQRCESQ